MFAHGASTIQVQHCHVCIRTHIFYARYSVINFAYKSDVHIPSVVMLLCPWLMLSDISMML